MLVRWLCSFPASALLDLVGLSTLVLPRPQAMHPSAKVREPTGCVFVQGRLKQVCPDGLAVTGFWARHAPYFEKRPESELLDLHVHRGPRPESSGIRWGRPAERHKKQRQRQATQPGENSQKDNPPEENRPRGQPPDHQARRRSRKETHPFPKWRKTEWERVIVQHEEDTSG